MEKQKPQIQVPGYLKVSKIVIWVLYFYVLLGIVALILQIILDLFNANQAAGFYKFVAQVSADYMQPFRGIFPSRNFESGGQLDVSALFAIVVYLLFLWGIHSLVRYIQNKIDIVTAQQEKELAELRYQKRLELLKSHKQDEPTMRKPSSSTK